MRVYHEAKKGQQNLSLTEVEPQLKRRNSLGVVSNLSRNLELK
jgi:hypothetical protein